MKKFTLLMMVLLLAMMAVMPVAAQDTNYDDIDPASLAGVTVDFWHQHSRFRETQLQAMVAVFNNPDVTVDEFLGTIEAEVTEAEVARLGEIIDGLRETAREYNPYGIVVNASNQGGYGDIFEKMTLGIVAGGEDLPQLVVAYQNQAATYQIDNALVDMTAMVNSANYGFSEEEIADFFPGFYNADVFPTFGGQRLGLAPNRSMEVMYYNIDWLNELYAAGAISFEGAPQTPDQFAEAACAAAANPFSLSASPDVQPIGYELSIDASRLASWTFAFNGDIFDYETGEYSLDSEAAISALEFIQGLFDDGCAVEVTENFGDQSHFGQGVTLFTVGSSSGLPFYDSAIAGAYETVEGVDGFSWSVAPLPHTSEEPRMNIYGASVSIPRSTPEQELAAWIFVKYYTSTVAQRYWAEASQYFPVRASVAAELGDYFAANPAYQTAFDLLQYGMAEPPVPGYDPVRNAMSETFAALVQDPGMDAAEALTELNTMANEELADLMADIQN